MAKVKTKVFGQRFCTYCGRNAMYYCESEDNSVMGVCDCGNIDYCDRETKEDVLKRFGDDMKEPDIDVMYFDD